MSSRTKVARLVDRENLPRKVPKAALARLQQMVLAMQEAQRDVNETVSTILETLGFEPTEWTINVQSGIISPKAKPAPDKTDIAEEPPEKDDSA